MFGFLAHVVFVLLCLGLGYMVRFSMEEFRELDRQVECMTHPEQSDDRDGRRAQPAAPSTASALQAMADPAKLAELKASLKK